MTGKPPNHWICGSVIQRTEYSGVDEKWVTHLEAFNIHAAQGAGLQI